ncbi:hypothetical protein C8R48DRAFT_775569 [Suillus tomentosus]|nr:hypothetical protein C8R48DRAFT_775569 [Suillus tomentosus]
MSVHQSTEATKQDDNANIAMEQLMNPDSNTSKPSLPPPLSATDAVPDPIDNFVTDDVEMLVPEQESDFSPGEAPLKDLKHCIWPDRSTQTLYSSWSTLIPTLIEAQLQYSAQTHGKPLEKIQKVISTVSAGKYTREDVHIDSLLGFETIEALSCQCSSLPQVLIHHGLFPTAPSQPQMAVSLELLSFYRALFERSCDAINALTCALKTYYFCRGFQLTDSKATKYENLFVAALATRCNGTIFSKLKSSAKSKTFSNDAGIRLHDSKKHHLKLILTLLALPCHLATPPSLMTETYHPVVNHTIPAIPSSSHQCYTEAGVWFVDEVGHRIHAQRKRTPKACNPLVPDEAIDLCEGAYEAADGKKQKAAMDSFDDTGYEILPEDVTNCLRFATTAMHAYGHEWACQLVYNPRMCVGLGLSDGEGTERLWSRFVWLISVKRSSSRQRRIWLFDCQATAIGQEMRMDLGDWIKRRLRRGIKDQGAVAQETLTQCQIPIEELRSQWHHQQKSQLSILTHAPARLKKELDTVLSLQADLDTSHRALQAAKSILGQESASDDTIQALESLARGHDRLIDKVETLYASLNIHEKFPELQSIDLEFVRILLTARDLKMNIHKRAIASFFEWDKLDRAVGGTQQALGTKLHQQTRKAIAKWQPVLMTAIRKFNSYCEQLESHYDISSGIPLLSPLPTKLADLRADPTLMEDVWITPSVGEVPRWLEDCEVRDGIRALLKHDRCQEEQLRLRTEADNLCRFFGEELAALELAVRYSGKSPDLEGDNDPTFIEDIPHVNSDQAALADLLEGDTGPLDHDNTNYTTNFGNIVDVNVLQWDVSENLLIDDYIPPCESNIVMPGTLTVRVRPPCDGFPHQIFEPKDIDILCSPTAYLNDVCIDSCAALLYSELKVPNVSCTILSTHDLPCIRYNAPDEVIWRQCSWTHYWEKNIWVLPIHRPSRVGHWVFCAIYLPSKELHLFDSLGDQKPWKHDIKEIMKLIGRLVLLARKHQYHLPVDLKGWVARQLNIQPLQTNNHNCGIWVLAAIIAVLRGQHVTGVREADIGNLQYYLSTLVLSLPSDVQ